MATQDFLATCEEKASHHPSILTENVSQETPNSYQGHTSNLLGGEHGGTCLSGQHWGAEAGRSLRGLSPPAVCKTCVLRVLYFKKPPCMTKTPLPRVWSNHLLSLILPTCRIGVNAVSLTLENWTHKVAGTQFPVSKDLFQWWGHVNQQFTIYNKYIVREGATAAYILKSKTNHQSKRYANASRDINEADFRIHGDTVRLEEASYFKGTLLGKNTEA